MLGLSTNTSMDIELANRPSEMPTGSTTEQCLLTKLIVHSIIGGCICVIGFIGNIVSMRVFGKDKQSPVAAYMLQWLAITDNIFIALWALHFPARYLILYSEAVTHPMWLVVRVYSYPLLFTAQMATIWITVVIATSRYIAVCLPYKAMHYITLPYSRKAIALTWLFAIVYNIPRFFEVTITFDNTTNATSPIATHSRTSLGGNTIYNLVYFDILYYITSFISPLLLLAILNSRLTIAYR